MIYKHLFKEFLPVRNLECIMIKWFIFDDALIAMCVHCKCTEVLLPMYLLCIQDKSPIQRGLGNMLYLPQFSLRSICSHYGERAGHAKLLHLSTLFPPLTQVPTASSNVLVLNLLLVMPICWLPTQCMTKTLVWSLKNVIFKRYNTQHPPLKWDKLYSLKHQHC